MLSVVWLEYQSSGKATTSVQKLQNQLSFNNALPRLSLMYSFKKEIIPMRSRIVSLLYYRILLFCVDFVARIRVLL